MPSTHSGSATSAQSGGIIGATATDKPSGEHVDKMVGPGEWPETDGSVSTDRATQLGEKLLALTTLQAAIDTVVHRKHGKNESTNNVETVGFSDTKVCR